VFNGADELCHNEVEFTLTFASVFPSFSTLNGSG